MMELGIIGLGKMGANIALQGVEKGIKIVGKVRGQKPELTQKGVLVVDDYTNFLANLSLMRHGFGGHPYGKDEYIANERRTSRIHPI
jgi:hypothetical protein